MLWKQNCFPICVICPIKVISLGSVYRNIVGCSRPGTESSSNVYGQGYPIRNGSGFHVSHVKHIHMESVFSSYSDGDLRVEGQLHSLGQIIPWSVLD